MLFSVRGTNGAGSEEWCHEGDHRSLPRVILVPLPAALPSHSVVSLNEEGSNVLLCTLD